MAKYFVKRKVFSLVLRVISFPETLSALFVVDMNLFFRNNVFQTCIQENLWIGFNELFMENFMLLLSISRSIFFVLLHTLFSFPMQLQNSSFSIKIITTSYEFNLNFMILIGSLQIVLVFQWRSRKVTPFKILILIPAVSTQK